MTSAMRALRVRGRRQGRHLSVLRVRRPRAGARGGAPRSFAPLRNYIMSALKENSPVRFTGGAYVGKKGTVERLTPHKAHVYSPELGKSVCVNKTSLTVDNLGGDADRLYISTSRAVIASRAAAAATFASPHSEQNTATVTGLIPAARQPSWFWSTHSATWKSRRSCCGPSSRNQPKAT